MFRHSFLFFFILLFLATIQAVLSETFILTFIFLSGRLLQQAGYDEEIVYATLGSITIRELKGIEQYTLI